MPKKTKQGSIEPYSRAIPSTCEILSYCHCFQCLEEMPKGVSPREWAQLEVGMTELGIQVWCRRHETNVVHFDLLNQKIAANQMSTSFDEAVARGRKDKERATRTKTKILNPYASNTAEWIAWEFGYYKAQA